MVTRTGTRTSTTGMRFISPTISALMEFRTILHFFLRGFDYWYLINFVVALFSKYLRIYFNNNM